MLNKHDKNANHPFIGVPCGCGQQIYWNENDNAWHNAHTLGQPNNGDKHTCPTVNKSSQTATGALAAMNSNAWNLYTADYKAIEEKMLANLAVKPMSIWESAPIPFNTAATATNAPKAKPVSNTVTLTRAEYEKLKKQAEGKQASGQLWHVIYSDGRKVNFIVAAENETEAKRKIIDWAEAGYMSRSSLPELKKCRVNRVSTNVFKFWDND